jgi:hypothetical protein
VAIRDFDRQRIAGCSFRPGPLEESSNRNLETKESFCRMIKVKTRTLRKGFRARLVKMPRGAEHQRGGDITWVSVGGQKLINEDKVLFRKKRSSVCGLVVKSIVATTLMSHLRWAPGSIPGERKNNFLIFALAQHQNYSPRITILVSFFRLHFWVPEN